MMQLMIFVAFLFVSASAHAKVKIGDRFPPIDLKILNSKQTFDNKTIRGKVVLIDIWGSDCPPCRLAMPKMNEIYLNLRKRDFVILGINVDESDDDVKYFLQEYKIDYPLLDDRKHGLVKTLGIEVMPTSYLVDSTGTVRYIHKGFRSGDGSLLEKQIRLLLDKKTAK
jgi:thiol-disulfide isomerase/thioredoxin